MGKKVCDFFVVLGADRLCDGALFSNKIIQRTVERERERLERKGKVWNEGQFQSRPHVALITNATRHTMKECGKKEQDETDFCVLLKSMGRTTCTV